MNFELILHMNKAILYSNLSLLFLNRYLQMKCIHISGKICVINVICLALVTLSVGCRSSHNKNLPKDLQIETIKITSLKGDKKKVVDEALEWLGTPYKYAGSEKGKGTDCSGMVVRVFEDATGKKLPRNSKKQSEYCKKIKQRDVEAGDLAFFATGKDKKMVSHVGIMIDKVQFIHASTKKGVIISDITTDYYQRTFIMYGRIPDK